MASLLKGWRSSKRIKSEEKNMRKIYSLGLVAVLSIMLLAIPALAIDYTVAIDLPAAGGEVSGTYTFNVTLTNLSTGAENVTNVSWFYTPSVGSTTYLGKNTSNIGAAWLSNVSVTINKSMSTLGLFDSGTYTIIACAWNASPKQTSLASTANITTSDADGRTCDSNTLVTVDNTVPAATTTLTANKEYNFPASLTGTVYNASSCYFTINNKVFTGTLTQSSLGTETCAYTLQSYSLPDGTYSVTVTGTDSSAGANATTSDGLSVIFTSKSGAARASAIAAGETQQGDTLPGQGLSPGARAAAVVGAVGIGYYLIAIKKIKILKLLGGK